MELLKLDDAVLTPEDVIFRESRVANLTVGLILLALLVGIIYMAIYHKPDTFFVCIGVPILGTFAVVVFIILNGAVKTFCPTNWLLAINPERILIKFRSYANCHFKNNDPQVVSIPLREIQAIRLRKETRKYLNLSENTSQMAFAKYLEIFLNGNASEEEIERLKARLSAEQTIREGTTSMDYPVSIPEDRMIQILWRSPKAHITPRISRLVEVFSKQRVRVEGDIKAESDFTDYTSWSREELDQKIRRLLENGDEFAAHALVKTALNMNTTQSQAYIKNLRSGRCFSGRGKILGPGEKI